MLGCLLSKKKKERKRQPLKRKQKEIKEYTLQELANKSIKCLSRCYCGMSVGCHFSCNRGGAAMPGGESHTTTTFGRTEVITKVLSWIPSYNLLWARDDLQGVERG